MASSLYFLGSQHYPSAPVLLMDGKGDVVIFQMSWESRECQSGLFLLFRSFYSEIPACMFKEKIRGDLPIQLGGGMGKALFLLTPSKRQRGTPQDQALGIGLQLGKGLFFRRGAVSIFLRLLERASSRPKRKKSRKRKQTKFFGAGQPSQSLFPASCPLSSVAASRKGSTCPV